MKSTAQSRAQDLRSQIQQVSLNLEEGERRSDELRAQILAAEHQQRMAQQEADEIAKERQHLTDQLPSDHHLGASSGEQAPVGPAGAEEEEEQSQPAAKPAKPPKARAKQAAQEEASHAEQQAPKKRGRPPSHARAAPETASAVAGDARSAPKDADSMSKPAKKRGRPPKAAASASAAAAGSTSEHEPPVASAIVAEDPGPGISVPSKDADVDVGVMADGLFTATSLLPDFRTAMIAKARKERPPVPGKAGETRTAYLISCDGSKKINGFVMWREEWGRRNGYDVELHQLSYPVGHEEVGTALLEAMIKRLHPDRSGTIKTKLSEKVSSKFVAIWKTFGFSGIQGSDTYERPFP